MKKECPPVDCAAKDVSNHNELELTVQSLLISRTALEFVSKMNLCQNWNRKDWAIVS